MTSRIQRKHKRRRKIEARIESRAAKRSKYGAKVWEQEHGRQPDPQATSKSKKKSGCGHG